MSSELLVSNITPAGDSGTVKINGSLKTNNIVPADDSDTVTVSGNLQAQSMLSVMKPYHVIRRLTFTQSSGKQLLDFGLSETNAKYVLASAFAYSASSGEFATIFFGPTVPDIDVTNTTFSRSSTFFNLDDSEYYTFLTMYYGSNLGCSQFLVIPLSDDKTTYVLPSDLQSDGIYIKIKTIGYIE